MGRWVSHQGIVQTRMINFITKNKITKWFHNLKIAYKLVCFVSLMAFFLINASLVWFYLNDRTNQAFRNSYQIRFLSVQYLNNVHLLILSNEINWYKLHLTNNLKEKQEIALEIKNSTAKFKKIFLKYISINKNQDVQYYSLQKQVEQLETSCYKSLKEELTNNKVQSYKDYDNYLRQINNFHKNIEYLTKHSEKQADAEYAHILRYTVISDLIIIFTIILGVIIFVLLSFKVTRIIIKPIFLLETKMKRVAEGNLAIEPIQTHYSDELRHLDNSFNVMIQKLHNLIQNEQKLSANERLLRSIIASIRNSLDIAYIKKILVTKAGKAFNADKCFIRFYDKENNTFFPVEKVAEYFSSPELTKEYFYNEKVDSSLIVEYKAGNFFKIPDYEEFGRNTSSEVFKFIAEKQLNYYGIKASYCFPIFLDGDFICAFILQFKEKTVLSEEDCELLLTIGDQAAIALKQAELYSLTKKQSERESLIRKVTEIIRSSLDITETLSIICDEVAKLFEAERAVIVEYPNKDNYKEYILRREYRVNKDIKGFGNIEIDPRTVEFWGKNVLEAGKSLAIENVPDSDTPDYFRNTYAIIGVKSIINVPIQKDNYKWGVLGLSIINKNKHWTENDINLLETITDQIYIAIMQAELYTAMRKQAEKERLLRKIVTTIKNNSNIDEFLNSLCKQIAGIFGIERVILRDFIGDFEKRFIRAEFIVDAKSKEAKDYYNQINGELSKYWIKAFADNKKVIAINNISEWEAPDDIKKLYIKMGIKSLICVPFKSCSGKWGSISLSNYTEYRYWNHDEITLLEDIAQHISLAVREASLYSEAQFLANVSHEIKTPLSMIGGHSQILLKDEKYFSNNTYKSLTAINDNVSRINNIINNLLYLLKLEKDYNVGEITFESVYIDDILDSAIKYCSDKAKSKNIKLELSSNSILVNANILLLQQAIINLIINAIQYSNNNSIIEIQAHENSKSIKVSIKDYGEGIPGAHLPYIFERFYRVDKSRSRETGGTGLGLSIVKLIIEAHKGQISVESTPNQNTTFSFQLPK